MSLATHWQNWAWLPLALALGGCASAAPTLPSPSPTPSATPRPTFAFPTPAPSRTPTPTVRPSPTPDPLARAGRRVHFDGFDQAAGWPVGEDSAGGTSVFRGALHVSVRQPRTLRLALAPAPEQGDAIVQVEVSSSICAPDDEFGLVLRANPQGEHYRAILTCAGGVRWARVLTTGSFVLARVDTGTPVIAGPLVRNILTVQASGPEFTLSVNGIQVLRLRDPVLVSGAVGVFVRSGAEGQTTVSFDNLAVYELVAAATATPVP